MYLLIINYSYITYTDVKNNRLHGDKCIDSWSSWTRYYVDIVKMISGRRHQLSHWHGWIVFAAARAPDPPSQPGGRGTPGQRSVTPCHIVTRFQSWHHHHHGPREHDEGGIRTLSLTPSEESWSVSTEEGEAREARVSANMGWMVLFIIVNMEHVF